MFWEKKQFIFAPVGDTASTACHLYKEHRIHYVNKLLALSSQVAKKLQHLDINGSHDCVCHCDVSMINKKLCLSFVQML